MAIFDDVNNGIKEAMKAKDKVRLEALRNIKKVMLEVKTAVGAADELDDTEAIKIISKLAKQGTDSATIYKEQGRDDLATAELEQVAVYETFLPEMLSDNELDKVIKQIIEQTGASGMKDMGKVMGVATKQLAGKADGKAISEKVRSLLQ
ncbi:MAG TPA: GatB/YqeY domain-containing protein [Prolixibacteraceae bacterium]|nr:GatB/YqeY domain-containing protein [Prolixibacteraceae bacterium]HPR59521.1 GatB/YqeY domain-containing protein [Prolixibacteraceae bacterium]